MASGGELFVQHGFEKSVTEGSSGLTRGYPMNSDRPLVSFRTIPYKQT